MATSWQEALMGVNGCKGAKPMEPMNNTPLAPIQGD